MVRLEISVAWSHTNCTPAKFSLKFASSMRKFCEVLIFLETIYKNVIQNFMTPLLQVSGHLFTYDSLLLKFVSHKFSCSNNLWPFGNKEAQESNKLLWPKDVQYQRAHNLISFLSHFIYDDGLMCVNRWVFIFMTHYESFLSCKSFVKQGLREIFEGWLKIRLLGDSKTFRWKHFKQVHPCISTLNLCLCPCLHLIFSPFS